MSAHARTTEDWPLAEDQEPIADPDPVDEPGTELVPVEEAELVPVEEESRLAPIPMIVNAREVQPVIADWLRDAETVKATAGWLVRRGAHLVAFHGVRVPTLYLCRVAFILAPTGFGRFVRWWSRWVSDADGRQVRQASATSAKTQPAEFTRMTEQQNESIKGRFAMSAAGILVVLGTAWYLISQANLVTFLLGVALVVGALAYNGRSPKHPVLSKSHSTDAPQKLSESLILTALRAMGIGELSSAMRNAEKPGALPAVTFPSPVRTEGPGWRADIDLPPGVTAGDIVERRERLAAGLRYPLASVWPTASSDVHAARVSLWVGHTPMDKAKPFVWPLAKRGMVDIFQPFVIGVDPQGQPVTITLMFALMVIGAMPRMGKSALLRLIVLACGLDPRVEIYLYDMKGGADFNCVEHFGHRLVQGDDDHDVAVMLGDARGLQARMSKRYKLIRRLAKEHREQCPDGKITPQLASRRDLDLNPIVVAIDECQIAFENREHGKDLEEAITDLAKRGPAVGIIVILATQRPDAKSLPTGISSNALLRYCLKVQGQTENDMVMGTSAYKRGIRATMFARTEMGVGYLGGEENDPVICRSAYVNGPQAEVIALRARAARQAAGRLTGEAAGEVEETEALPGPLDHILQVWPAGDPKAQYATLAERLGAEFPQVYGGWTADQVSAVIRGLGLAPVQVKRNRENKPGAIRAQVEEAMGRE